MRIDLKSKQELRIGLNFIMMVVVAHVEMKSGL